MYRHWRALPLPTAKESSSAATKNQHNQRGKKGQISYDIHMWNLFFLNGSNELTYKIETDIKTKLMVTKGETWWGGIN